MAQLTHKAFRTRIICSKCGNKINDFGYENTSAYKVMKEHNLCFECARWKMLLENWGENYEVIEGSVYDIKPIVTGIDLMLRSHSCSTTRYIAKKDGTGKVSNDIQLIGKPPAHFDLQNTAWWIPEKWGKRLLRETFSCTCKGCMDRYHCFRYDYRQEFDIGPFNVVPREWIVGDERCSSFIDITKITHFDSYVDPNDLL